MAPLEYGIPTPNAGIPLIDQLAIRHPILRTSGKFLVLDWMFDEHALAAYEGEQDGIKESFADPKDFAIAWSLLYYATTAALDAGYLNLRDPDRKDGFSYIEDNEQVSSIALGFLQSIRGTGVAPITTDIITKLMQTRLSLGEEPGVFGSLKGPTIIDAEGQPTSIFDVFWHVDGRALTHEEEQTIRGDLEKITRVTRWVMHYIQQRAKQTDSPPGVALYFPDHRFAEGFVYSLGWKPKTAVQKTQQYVRDGQERIQIDILDVLTDWWSIRFRQHFESRGLIPPPIRFRYPYKLGGTDFPPMPMDVDFESQAHLHMTGPSFGELDSLCEQLFQDWHKGKTIGIDEIVAALEERKEKNSRFLSDEDMIGMNMFHLWAIALKDANDRDWVKRRGALDPDQYRLYETDAYAAYASERDQFATLIQEAMMEPDLFAALPPEIQQVIPFFTGGR